MKNLLLLILSAILFAGCKDSSERKMSVLGEAFGTTYSIQYYSENEFDAKKAIDSLVNTVNQSVSTYLTESDISKINQGDTTVVVDEIFAEVFNLSEEVHKKSNGYFDPTIGVLRNAYGFGDVKPLKTIDSVTLDSLRQFVGFDKVKITSKGTIQKENPAIYFDFNAIAKGYGIDLIGDYLNKKGVENFLIELGGELLAKGENIEKKQPWKVGIETVTSELDARSYSQVVILKDRAMASSGNYRKFRIDSASGKKYVHTINPLTGKAEQSDVTSASVLAPTCAIADAYATSFMAMGLEKSKALLQKLPDVEAYLTYSDTVNKQQVFVTEGFKKFISE